MQISEMVSYVGMIRTTKYEVLLILTQKYKMEERVKTENNLATQAVYGNVLYIFIFIFHFEFTCTFTFNTRLRLKKYFSYLSTINVTYFKTFTQVIF